MGNVIDTFERDPASWQRAAMALAVSVAILAVSTAAGLIATALFDFTTGIDRPRAYAPSEQAALTTARLAIFLLAFQLIAILATLIAASRSEDVWQSITHLRMPRGGILALLTSIALLLSLALIYAMAVYNIDRQALTDDVKLFAEIIQTETWWLVALAAAIGAPIAEEILFRGYLYGMLRTTPVGAGGAGLVSAFLWSALHAQYSGYGLAAIFIIGLYFAWLRERSGGLLVPICCHAGYNTLIVAALLWVPQLSR